MSEHTPGPWRVGLRGHAQDTVFTNNGRRIAEFMPRRDDPNRSSLEDFANARLAAASPDMYAALKSARRTIIAAVESGVDIPGFDPAEHVTVREIDAALAKAEGGAPDA